MLRFTFEFKDGAPRDLTRVLQGFDPTIDEVSALTFKRPYPIQKHHSKSGIRWDNVDTNWPLHKWFRQLERQVLRPLHRNYPIVAIQLERIR